MNRYRFPIAILILSVMTFGLLVTASPTPDAQAAPRSIPWDCSDWQETPAVADAEDARVSMILESLAANRGKSIYCAIDQSDTWTKSETWLAGRDRNERDDTVYFGQQGNFRGFLAAQEGYLTDGESGVTGISRDRIFEFPEEPRRGKKTVIKRLRLTERVPWGNYIAASANSANQPSAHELSGPDNASTTLIENARNNWCIHASVGASWTGPIEARCITTSLDWTGRAQTAAEAECIARGYPRLRTITSADIVDPGPPDRDVPGRGFGHWEYEIEDVGGWAIRTRQFRLYNAVCEKKVRVRRR